MKKNEFLAVIPARGGSKGLPRKNIKKFANKPLIAWTIEEAKKSKYIDRVIVSSDDEDIIDISKHYGADVPFVRPKKLAKDSTPGIEVILHAVDKISGYKNVIVLQPTSPLRSVMDIDSCIEYFLSERVNSCVSVTESDKSPYWMYNIRDNGNMLPIIEGKSYTLRQQIPPAYVLNGAIYISRIEWLKKAKNFLTAETIGYVMPKERSFDIDTDLDFRIAQFIKLSHSN